MGGRFARAKSRDEAEVMAAAPSAPVAPSVRRPRTVSAVDDPAERAAERVAATVVRRLGTPTGALSHAPPASRIRRASAAVPAPTVVPEGGTLDATTSSRIRAAAGRGTPIDDTVRAPLEQAFGADFSDVSVHHDSPLAPAVGAIAFTLGRDIHLAPGAAAPATSGGLHLLAHELAHVVQQGGAATSEAQRATIYRHASFEHLMLGEVDPLRLRAIPDQRLALLLEGGDHPIPLRQETAFHVLRQERERLRQWQANEPKSLGDVDPAWQVHAVEIRSRTPSNDPRTTTICTYGEMNMLADYFGSPDEIYAAEAHTLWKLLQTERAEYYDKLGEMLDGLMARDYVVKQETQPGWFGRTSTVDVKWFLPENAPEKDHYTPDDYTVREGSSRLTQQAFEGDQRYGIAKSDQASMSGLENLVAVPGLLPQDQGLTNFYGPGKGTGTAWGVTARNACHFAPESWRSWETYHRTAIELAADASRLRESASAPATTAQERERWLARADKLANEAWINNGFADHYLQDSFAAGHLINKTLVSQWYMREINTWFTGPAEALWNRLIMMGPRRQPGLGTADYTKAPGVAARNPQAAANAASTREAWDASGLGISLSPEATTVLGQLRAASAQALTAVDWSARCGLDLAATRNGLNELVDEELAVIVDPVQPGGPARVQLAARYAPAPGQVVSGDGGAAARTVTAQLYHEWLQNSLIQAGAGALHDHFCKQGLWVATGEGERPFKIFGDDRMLSAGAGEGVAFAAETARMSQDNIRTVLQRGRAEEGVRSIGRIIDRFPSHVVPQFESAAAVYKAKDFGLEKFKPPGGQPISLANWHTELERYMTGSYLQSLFSTWSHHYVSQTPISSELVPFAVISPHAGAEF